MSNASSGEAAQKLNVAIGLHQAGDLLAAQRIYQEILQERPEEPAALHLLGLVAHQQGRNEEAKGLIGSAIAKGGAGSPFFHNNLGEVLRTLGENTEAQSCYEEALRLDPDYVQAHNNLGLVRYELGDLSGSVQAFGDALAREPKMAQIHNNLGLVRQAQGDLGEALLSFERAVAFDPDHPEALNNLGAALQDSGRLSEAGAALEKAVAVSPNLARGHYNLARLRAAYGDFEGAEQAVREALRFDGSQPDFAVNLGYFLRAQGRLDESIQALRGAVALMPGHPVALNDLGVSLLVKGEFEEARSYLRRALKQDPGFAVAYENLAKSKRFGSEDAAEMRQLEMILREADPPTQARTHLHFSLAKMLDDVGDSDRAFEHYRAGNESKRTQIGFSREAHRQVVDQMIATASRDFLGQRADWGHPSESLVFIVGMPRSGTTLVEQILASHPNVFGAGELDFFRLESGRLSAESHQPYALAMADMTRAQVDELAASYMRAQVARAPEALRYTDKMPVNFEHLGLIALAFPRAKVIHCVRDPMDLCFSIYCQHFAAANEYAYDFEDIAAYYFEYLRLMDHWRAVLPEGMVMDLRYEDLITDLDGKARELVGHIGLVFDEKCLAFHETRRPVGTASHWQVRQPIYKDSVERWKRYESHLEPLRRALGLAGE